MCCCQVLRPFSPLPLDCIHRLRPTRMTSSHSTEASIGVTTDDGATIVADEGC